jgi:two-component system sensor histidine kinase KdpD
LTGPGTSATVTRLCGPIDVHLVTHEEAAAGRVTLPVLTGGLTARRRVLGLFVAVVLLPVLTVVCTALRGHLLFAGDISLYLLVVIVTALVGGFYPALLAAVAGSLLLNYYLTAPIHTFTIDEPSNTLALAIFLVVAALVSHVVDLAARRSSLAARAGAEAETLSVFAGSLLRGEQALPALLERVRETFGMDGATLLRRRDSGWEPVASAGLPADPTNADARAEVDGELQLALHGHPLPAEDQRVLSAFAAHVGVAYRQEQLAEAAAAAVPLAESDRQRTALLNAVSHDLRTPIASAKAAVSSLRGGEVDWDEAQQKELLATAEDSLDRLTGLVTNLLDLSRLQAGVLPVLSAAVGLDDVVARALDQVGADGVVEVDVPADLPEVSADAGLLERVVANVVQNALRYAPDGTVVRVAGSAHGGRVELRVLDRGPGIPAGMAETVFQPFQRTDDAPGHGDGVGLGLAIARGFAEAMGGTVIAEPTPGGGTTVVISLREAAG